MSEYKKLSTRHATAVFVLSLAQKHRTEFNDLLVDSVTETITEIFGSKVTPAFWYHYQGYLGISRDEIPYRLETLFSGLKGAFGIGGETLGRSIIKKLYAKADVPLIYVQDKPFAEYVEELKETLAKTLMVHVTAKS